MSFLAAFDDAAMHARDPVRWARDRTHFDPDPWQQDFLRTVAAPLLDPAGEPINSHTLLSPRQTGKSTTLGLLAAWWADMRKPVQITRVPGRDPIRTILHDKGPTIGFFAASARQAESGMKIAVDFLIAAGASFKAQAADRVILKNGAKLIALPAEATARGETLSLAILDEAGWLPAGGETATGVITPMMASFAPEASALVLSSTPGPAVGLYYRHVTDPRGMRTNLTQVSLSQNPRVSLSFLRAERARMGELHFSCEYGDIEDLSKPPQFLSDGRGLFTMGAMRDAVTDELQPLDLEGCLG